MDSVSPTQQTDTIAYSTKAMVHHIYRHRPDTPWMKDLSRLLQRCSFQPISWLLPKKNKTVTQKSKHKNIQQP